MSYTTIIDVKGALYYDEKLTNSVRRILKAERDVSRFIGNTTITAYRRVHEVVGSSLERTLEYIQRGVSAEALPLLTKSLILVNYQKARGQISRDMANTVAQMLEIIISEVQNVMHGRVDFDKIKGIITRAHTLLDALIVLVYQHGKR